MKANSLGQFLWIIALFLFPISAQVVPSNEVADFTFDRGVEFYQSGDYIQAYQRFYKTINEFPLHRKTTAAYMMAGKTLFNQGKYGDAANTFQTLLNRYPDSKYVTEARRLQQESLEAQAGPVQARVSDLGILLPLRRSPVYAKHLFSGIRIAVEEHNAKNPSRPVRMVFRDSGGEASTAQAATTSIIQQGGADAIIGPLTSLEGVAAGETAEQNRIPMVSPVATNGAVSAGRRYVFQSSSTFDMRGRQMARYAVQELGLKDLGIFYEAGSANEESARTFEVEARALGAQITFVKPLANATEWIRLNRNIDEATAKRATGIYMPISGENSLRNIGAALNSLDQMRLSATVLGNPDWHELDQKDQAARYRTVYTTDTYVNDTRPEVQDFNRRYRAITNEAPDQLGLSYTGYDIAAFMIPHLVKGGDILQNIKANGVHTGLGRKFDFKNDNVNQATHFLKYANGQIIFVK
jgi:branched-chain amino acid transport system substrate-binding protein